MLYLDRKVLCWSFEGVSGEALGCCGTIPPTRAFVNVIRGCMCIVCLSQKLDNEIHCGNQRECVTEIGFNVL